MTTRRRAAHPPAGFMQLIDSCRHCGEFFEPTHDGDYIWNLNNYIGGDTCRIRPRK